MAKIFVGKQANMVKEVVTEDIEKEFFNYIHTGIQEESFTWEDVKDWDKRIIESIVRDLKAEEE